MKTREEVGADCSIYDRAHHVLNVFLSYLTRIQPKSESRIKQMGRTRRLRGKSPEQTAGSWTRIHKCPRYWCTPSRDWSIRTKCTHTDAGCMSADPGLDTEAHMDQRHDINPRNTGPNVCVWLQISSLTKRSVCYCLPVFSSLLPRHLCLRFKSLK